MIRAALGGAIAVYGVLAMMLLRECVFLAPLKHYIWDHYGVTLLWWSALLITNLFCVFYAVLRRIGLEDTGEKLAHLEKQLRGRETISEELTARLSEQK